MGPSKPLTGWAMEDLAGAYKRPPEPNPIHRSSFFSSRLAPRRGRLEEAKRLILGALRVECSKVGQRFLSVLEFF